MTSEDIMVKLSTATDSKLQVISLRLDICLNFPLVKLKSSIDKSKYLPFFSDAPTALTCSIMCVRSQVLSQIMLLAILLWNIYSEPSVQLKI